MVEAADLPPAFLGAHPNLADDQQHRLTADTAFGPITAVTDGGKCRLDGVGGAQAQPVLGQEVVEDKQHLAVLAQASYDLGVLCAIDALEAPKAFLAATCSSAVQVSSGTTWLWVRRPWADS